MNADDDQPTNVDPHTDNRPAPVAAAEEVVTESIEPSPPSDPGIDLDAMTADLDGVDAALARLADGTYWIDEVTGEAISPAVLEANPMARRS